MDNSTVAIESEGEPEEDQQDLDLARVRKIVAKKADGAVLEGDVQQINQVIRDEDCRVPEPEVAPTLTVQDVMPTGRKDQEDRNPQMVANARANRNLQDVHIARAGGAPKGMSLPSETVFREVVNNALTNMSSINMAWCNVCTYAGVNKLGIGVIQVNYGCLSRLHLWTINCKHHLQHVPGHQHAEEARGHSLLPLRVLRDPGRTNWWSTQRRTPLRS